MKLSTHLYLPENYLFAKFGCYSLNYDVIIVSLTEIVLVFLCVCKFKYDFVIKSIFKQLYCKCYGIYKLSWLPLIGSYKTNSNKLYKH